MEGDDYVVPAPSPQNMQSVSLPDASLHDLHENLKVELGGGFILVESSDEDMFAEDPLGLELGMD